MNDKVRNIIEGIINCSRIDDYSEIEILFKNRQEYQYLIDQIQNDFSKLNNGKFLHYYDIFYQFADKYDFDDLLLLIKGLTIAENFTGNCGSVSPIIALYKNLVHKVGLNYLTTGDKQGIYILIHSLEKNPNSQIEYITNWILKNSKNSYLPFGISTLVSKTIPDIKIEVEIWFTRQKEISDREKQEEIDKALRDEQRQNEIEFNKVKHNDKTEQEKKYRTFLNNLQVNELLMVIINDNIRPIYFYLNELEKVNKIEDNLKPILKKVLSKFKQEERGQIKKIKSKLMEISM